jgi:hypothetical protein
MRAEVYLDAAHLADGVDGEVLFREQLVDLHVEE